MNKITVIIIDDEKQGRERLKDFCGVHPDMEVIGEADNGRSAIGKIEELKPDLIFLDIQMPDITGIDVLKNIQHQPQVIFCTAHDEYAVKAFEHEAIDFLLKPFSRERFDSALEKIKDQPDFKKDLAEEMQKILSVWQNETNWLRRIPAKVGDRIHLINTGDITHFTSENKYVFAFLKDKHLAINYTLDELQKRLDPNQFFRIHRSTIVNLDFVGTIEPWFSGSFMMYLNDGKKTELKISRNSAKELKQLLGW